MVKTQEKQGFAMPKHRWFLFDAVDLPLYGSPQRARQIFVSDHKNCWSVG